jgi:MFS transporter, ACS family, hexuronate transporter
MDRNILGVLKPTIQGDLHFSETDFGNIIFFFSIAYAIGYAGMGWLTDKIGIRLGLAAAAILWCLASTAHGMVASVTGFILARIVLGLGEGGNFPTCIKTIATWFPLRDRAFATGCSTPAVISAPWLSPWPVGRRRSTSPARSGWSGSCSG